MEKEEIKRILDSFSNFCHEHYKGCSAGELGRWEYSYDNEIVNYIEPFLASLTKNN